MNTLTRKPADFPHDAPDVGPRHFSRRAGMAVGAYVSGASSAAIWSTMRNRPD